MRVAYYTYIVTKEMNLNYKEATIAALLHDFFIDEVKDMNSLSRLRKHPSYALENAKKYYELNDMQEDIIIHHMFPVTIIPPRYIESWIVDIIDDISAIYDKVYSMRKQLATIFNSFILFIIGIFKI